MIRSNSTGGLPPVARCRLRVLWKSVIQVTVFSRASAALHQQLRGTGRAAGEDPAEDLRLAPVRTQGDGLTHRALLPRLRTRARPERLPRRPPSLHGSLWMAPIAQATRPDRLTDRHRSAAFMLNAYTKRASTCRSEDEVTAEECMADHVPSSDSARVSSTWRTENLQVRVLEARVQQGRADLLESADGAGGPSEAAGAGRCYGLRCHPPQRTVRNPAVFPAGQVRHGAAHPLRVAEEM